MFIVKSANPLSAGEMFSTPFSSVISRSTSGMFLSTAESFSQNTVVLPGIVTDTGIEDVNPMLLSDAFMVSMSFEASRRTLLIIDSEFFELEKLLA